MTTDDIKLTKAESLNYDKFKLGLFNKLLETEPQNYSDAIIEYTRTHKNVMGEKVAMAIDNIKKIENPDIEIAQSLDKKYGESFDIDKDNTITITPVFFYLDQTKVQDDVEPYSSDDNSIFQRIQEFFIPYKLCET